MKSSIDLAITNIAKFGDTDIFPFTFERHLFFDSPELMAKAIQELHENYEEQRSQYPPQNIYTLAPVGYTGFRWATQLDPLWNAYYLSLVLEIGNEIESARIPISDKSVFSYRYNPNPDEGKLFSESVNWRSFAIESLLAAESSTHVIICDIADFYSRIYHHRVENSLKWLKAKDSTVKRIVDVLQLFSGTVSYGLPVGGPASRMLAELALNSVDQLLSSKGYRYCRFVDDYRIFCSSREDAYHKLIYLSEKLFNEGLTLQKAKTRILTAKEYRDEMQVLLRAEGDELDLTDEDKLLSLSIFYDPYSETSVEDYEDLKEQVSRIDIAGILARELTKTRIDTTITKQAISAISAVSADGQRRILESLLQVDNLQTLAPVFPRLMTVLRGLYKSLDESTQDLVDNSLSELIDSGSHIAHVDLNLSYMIQVLRQRSTRSKELLFVRLYSEHDSPLIKREIILAMASWGHNYWLTDIKGQFNYLTSWERRAFIIASYFLTDEGKHWRAHNNKSFSKLEVVVRDWYCDRFKVNETVPY